MIARHKSTDRNRSRSHTPARVRLHLEPLERRLLLTALGEPYLQAVAENSVYVLLEADSQDPVTVDYGLTASYGSQAVSESFEQTSGQRYVHNVKLTGLAANTVYHYQATHEAAPSADYSFQTAVQAGTGFRFAWMADMRTGTSIHDTIAGLVDGYDPSFSLYGGDLCNEASRNSWNAEFFVPNERALIAQVPFFNAVGNHEGFNAMTRAFTQAPDAAGDANGYYSFDYGDMHVLVLNTEIDHSNGSAQWNFAAADLAASTAPWKIVTFHKPAYSSYRVSAPNMVDMTTQVFEPGGVDMVLTGHDHSYEHNLVNGIHHMVIGSAGAPLYNPPGASYTVYHEQTYCFGIFDLTPTSLTMTTYREDGSVIETLVLGPDVTPPSASLATPLDNGPDDLDPALGAVTVGLGQAAFEVQLHDVGDGIDDATVGSPAVTLSKGGSPLVEGTDYYFSYDAAADLITLTGDEAFDTNNYQIALGGGAQIQDLAGNPLAATTFDVVIDRDLADAFTMIVLPDTQFYSETYPDIFDSQTQWVADNAATENLVFATHVGDVVQNGAAVPVEWTRADTAIDKLDGVLPYSVAPGNHDYDTPISGGYSGPHTATGQFEANFGGGRYTGYDWYLGDQYNSVNHAQKFTAGGQEYLHIALQFEPLPEDVAWAQGLMDDPLYRNLPVIISTHSYLTGSGRSTSTRTTDGGLSGEQLFQQLVRPNPQVFMVLCGHVGGEYYQTSLNDAGLEVFEILADYQGRANGGDGWMRLMEFVPAQNRIDVKTYTPYQDQWETDAGSQFSLSVDFDQRFSFAPTGSLMTPLDGGPEDLDPGTEDRVLTNQEQSQFQVRLTDVQDDIDWDSVIGSTVEMWKDTSTLLIEGTDYTFGKSADGADVIVTLTPTPSPFGDGLYEIVLNPSGDKIQDLDGNELESATLTVEIDTSIVPPQTVSFQQGAGGYSGTVDTNLFEDPARADTSFASAASLNVDADEPAGTGNVAQVLMRFENVFGGNPGQVPTDATITSATLELSSTNAGDSINLHRMLQTWADTGTFNGMVGGIQADGSEAAAVPDASTGAFPMGVVSIDVTASLTTWQAAPASDFGWAMLPTAANGADFDSAEGATPPKLVVDFIPGVPNDPPVANDDAYSLAEGATLTANDADGTIGDASDDGVAANDTDPDLPDDTLTVNTTPVSGPAYGSLTLNTDGTFVYTHDGSENFADGFTYELSDALGATDTATVSITITPVNDAPVLTPIGDQSIDEGSPLTFTATATDSDLPPDTLTFSLAGAVPAGASITSGGDFSWTPTEDQGPGDFTFDVVVGDGGLSDSETITVTVGEVNTAPVLDPIGNQAVNELDTLSFTATASDADLPANALTFSLSGEPAGAVITSGGDFSWTPTEAQGPGALAFDVVVSDGSLSDSETITVTVGEVNVAPVLDAIGDQIVDEGIPLTFTATATDADLPANTLTFSLSGEPAGAGITSGGDFSWTPTEAQGPGVYTFDVLVSDGSLSDGETITVTVNEANIAPVLDPVGDQAVDEGNLLTFQATATDPDSPPDGFAFSLAAGAPAGATITSGGDFSWTPTETQGPGSYPVTVQVTDDGTPPMMDSETITVTVGEVNTAPVLDPIGDQAVNELDTLSFTATASDVDLPANGLAFSLDAGAPAGASIDPDTGVFTWTPSEAQGSGSYPVTIRVTDDGTLPLDDSEIITITVNEVNEAPVLGDIGNQTADEGSELSFTATATDPDLPANGLAFSLDAGAPAGAGIDPLTGVFTWTPTEAQGPGSFPLTVRVTDNGTPVLDDSETITITVGEVNQAPVFTTPAVASVAENSTAVMTVTATDADLPVQTVGYSISGGNDADLFSIEIGTGELSFAAAPDYEIPGDVGGDNVYQVDVTADDGFGGTAVQSITVTVTAVNDNDPVFTSSNTATVPEGTTAVMTVAADDADLPPQTIGYSISGGADQTAFTIDSGSGALSFISAPNFDPPGDADGDNVYLVDVTADDGAGGTAVQSIAVTVIAAVRVYDGDEVNQEIPDQGTLTTTLTVGDSFSIADLDVELNINHARDQDLDVFLISPGGTTVELFTDVGANGDNFIGTVLDDEAAISITEGTAAFTGSYRPEGNLSDFDGGSVTGEWKLEITDDKRRTGGVLVSWSLIVTPGVANDPPVAVNDGATTDEDVSVNIDVLGNDTDPENDPLTITILSSPNGTAVVNDGATPSDPADDTVDFTPAPDFFGTASFTYQVNDGQNDSNIATVSVDVAAVNDAPLAGDDSAGTTVNVPVNIDVLANDTDAENDPLWITITGSPNGTATVNDGGTPLDPADDTVDFTPAVDFQGAATFTYRLSDNQLDSNEATVTITVSQPGSTIEVGPADGQVSILDPNKKGKVRTTEWSFEILSTDVFVADLNVELTILHADVGQLEASLISPSGEVLLFDFFSAATHGDEADFSGTVFDDEATELIADGVAPFAGSFQPQGSLGAFAGAPLDVGIWTLRVRDHVTGTVGTIESWSLLITADTSQGGTNVTLAAESAMESAESGGSPADGDPDGMTAAATDGLFASGALDADDSDPTAPGSSGQETPDVVDLALAELDPD